MYMLIIVVLAGTGIGGVSSQAVEYQSKARCERAKAVLRVEMPYVAASCIPVTED